MNIFEFCKLKGLYKIRNIVISKIDSWNKESLFFKCFSFISFKKDDWFFLFLCIVKFRVWVFDVVNMNKLITACILNIKRLMSKC